MTKQSETVSGLGKPAPADAEVHELIRERWSPRAFAPAPLTPAELRSLLEAARWAPSSMNEQPWAFVVGDRFTDPEGHARIVETLVPVNAAWASQAPVLILAVARLANARNGAPNRHAHYDTGQAVALLTVQATALGLVVHQMGGFDAGKARQLLGIPEGYEPMAVLAVGHPGNADALPADLRAREVAPRQRRPIAEWVHRGLWGRQQA